MAVRIQFRRGTGAEWDSADPVLALGELGYVTTTNTNNPAGGIKFGDGVTPWTSLPFAAAGDIYQIDAGTGMAYESGTTGFGSASAGLSGVVKLGIDTSKVLSTSSITAKGDLLIGSGNAAFVKKSIGSNNAVLTANSSSTGGVDWSSTLTKVSLKSPLETWNVVASAPTASTGATLNFDVATSSAWFYTSAATNSWVLNVRDSSSATLNSVLAIGQSITLSLAVTLGTTGVVQEATDGFKIDGTAVTVQWQNALAPTSVNTSAIDVYTYTIVKTADATFTVFGSRTKFDAV